MKIGLLVCSIAFFGFAMSSCNNASKDAKDATEETMDDAADTAEEAVIEKAADETGMEYTSAYVCPMHCKGSGSAEAGKCPVCGMDYVANDMDSDGDETEGDEAEGADEKDGHEGHNHK